MNKLQVKIWYAAFDDIVSESFDKDEIEILAQIYDFTYFRKVLEVKAAKRDFTADDVRGFGEGNISELANSLILLFQHLGMLVGGKIVADAAATKIYSETLEALNGLDRTTFEKYQPWSGRLKSYLEKKS